MHMRPSFSPFLECVSFLFYLFGVFLQTQGRTLPLETICLQSSSFTAGTDFSWSREVVRDAAISSVRDCLIKKSKPKSGQSEFIFADSVICISTHSPTWGVLIDCLLFILCLDSPQCLGHLLSSPLCRADWGAGYNLKKGGRPYWAANGEAPFGGAERWSHWDLCEEHSLSPCQQGMM